MGAQGERAARRCHASEEGEEEVSTPRRIQRKRTKGWRMPAGAVYVGRPTRFGNPWQGVDYALSLYHDWLAGKIFDRGLPPSYDEVQSLRGKDLACWCRLDRPCHADILLELANRAPC